MTSLDIGTHSVALPLPHADAPTTVKAPGRAARVLRRMLSARGRSLEITRAGWLFIVLTLAVGFTAVNSGSNLLHLVFGAQMALIIGSGMLSEAAVARTTARRVPTSTIHAQTPAAVRVELTNTDARRDILSVSVEDDDRRPTSDRCDPVFAVRIPGGARITLHTSVVMMARGRHHLPPAVCATRFPFGLFVKRRELGEPELVTVLPRIHSTTSKTGGDPRPGHGPALGRPARIGEFYGLREYREGDDPRHLHWPAVARVNRPVVREYEAYGDTELVLDLAAGRTGDPVFEHAVEHVASQAVAALREPGLAVGLRYAGVLVVPPRSGAEQRRHLLEVLALVGDGSPSP